ncbi:MAG TPA: DUF308 domain-containing protein [Anaerolineae bacterium]|nr:DUF308 domain-containing protein [Anaerolineae bacterium]HNU05484.1 DUF308 domain-containing protein [Anaerolineae bacterium]
MSATSLETKQRPWWLSLIIGIFAVIIGAVLLWSPAKTKVDTWFLLISLLGLYWLVTGIFDLVGLFTDRTAWGWKLFMGIISIVAGAYILMYPIASGLALPRIMVLVLGIWGLLQGIVMLIMAFRGGGWAAGILGVLAIIFGGILVANYSMPGAGLSLIWAAALFALIGGVVMIFQSLRGRSA